MKQIHYIDKTFPITLQDLLDLAKSKNLDPRDLKLIMNSNQADLSAYVQCALLNQDCDKTSIELYTSAEDGLHEDISLKTKKRNMKQITITEDLYNKLLNSTPIMETKDQNLLLLEQLKTELYTNGNLT